MLHGIKVSDEAMVEDPGFSPVDFNTAFPTGPAPRDRLQLTLGGDAVRHTGRRFRFLADRSSQRRRKSPLE